MHMFHPPDIKSIIVGCKQLKISEEEFYARLLPADFIPTQAFNEFDTIIAKDPYTGKILEYGYGKKEPAMLRDFFQSGTRVAVITVVHGTERKRRTVKRTHASPEYLEQLSHARHKKTQTAPS